MTTKKNNQSVNKVNKEDRALNLFAEMMIEKIETIQSDWKKPWFTEGTIAWPRNLSGREYNGMNAMMLMMLCEKEGFKNPMFLTYNKCVSLNFTDGKDGRVPATDAEGNKLPWVHVLKDQKSFPVFLTSFTVVADDGTKIKYDDYKQLSEEERSKYRVFPATTVYDVFNIDQTNLAEARPELYRKLTATVTRKLPEHNGEMFTFEPFDRMVAENKWICPISLQHQDDAYYSISKNMIVMPEKCQFTDGEAFYSNAFHECIHSTGAEGHLNRLKPSAFGSDDYAREELVAELGAALTAHRYGFDKGLKYDSAAYLKVWLKCLKEQPSYIKTVLQDVKRAVSILTQRLDALGGVQHEEESPMLRQFKDLKAKHPDALLLFRCGDFYETYEDDAESASKILGITLTKRHGSKVRMAGFPYHALDTYLPKLIRAGRRVAICDQIQAPKGRVA